MYEWLAANAHILVACLLPVAVPLFLFQVLPLLVLMERRGAAYIQDRVGPNRAALHLQFKGFKHIFGADHTLGGLRLRAFGMIFNLADLAKLLFKEVFKPPFAQRGFYGLAPAIPLVIGLLTPAVLPFFAPIGYTVGNELVTVHGTSLPTDNGLLVLFALGSLSVYGVVLGSWASSSKYPLLGGLRASAMMISYEVSMGLAVLGMLLIVGSFSLTEVVEWQGRNTWGIVVQPIGFLMFLVAMFAETNRNPFDVAEGESEIVGGFHTEYGGIKFMLFMSAEYLHIIVASLLITTLFLGGYQLFPWPGFGPDWVRDHVGQVLGVMLGLGAAGAAFLSWLVTRRRNAYLARPTRDAKARAREYGFYAGLFILLAFLLGAGGVFCWTQLHTPTPIQVRGVNVYPGWVNILTAIAQVHILMGKALLVCWLFVWVRWTLPRFRYDQIMGLGWKVLLNVALINLLATAVIAKAVGR